MIPPNVRGSKVPEPGCGSWLRMACRVVMWQRASPGKGVYTGDLGATQAILLLCVRNPLLSYLTYLQCASQPCHSCHAAFWRGRSKPWHADSMDAWSVSHPVDIVRAIGQWCVPSLSESVLALRHRTCLPRLPEANSVSQGFTTPSSRLSLSELFHCCRQFPDLQMGNKSGSRPSAN